MSNLFKRNAPHMTDDEDRRAWERVRQAVRPVPWWAAAWQRPAVRYGLPAVAVVLVGIVWVAVEQPASTRAPSPRTVALERSRPEPRPNTPAPPAPAAQGSPTLAARPAEPLARSEAKKAPRGEMHDFVAPPASTAPVVGGAPATGAPADQPARAKALLKEEPVAAQNEVAPRPAAAPQALAPPPPAGATLGVMKSTARGEAGTAASPTPAMRSLSGVRGGRADELSLDTVTPGPALGAVAAALVHRPLAFSAPLPLSVEGANGAIPAARIEVDANGATRARLVAPGAPGQTFARYADAGVAERILLVAVAADLVNRNSPPDRVALLRAEAARLAAAGPEPAAAQALLDQLSRLGK